MNILVVGYGTMGKHHARTLRRLGVPMQTLDPSAQSGADHHMLSQELIDFADIVCVATPPEELAHIARLWLERGKHVLIEKPMAIDLDHAQALLKAELESDRRIYVGYTERYNPAVIALRQALPMAGTIRHITAQRLGLRPRCPKTGPALDLLTHDIDVLRSLELWPRYLHSTTDGAHVTATFSLTSGSATLQASHLHPTKQRTLTVVGDDGMLSLDYQRQSLIFHDHSGAKEIDVDRCEPLEAEWRAVLNGEGVSSGSALATLRLALRAAGHERMASAGYDATDLQRGGVN